MSESELSATEVELARKYDLTPKLTAFLDRHLIYPLIMALDLIYDENTVTQLSYDLLKDTYMVKFEKSKFSNLYPGKEFPKELLEKEEFVQKELVRLDEKTKETLNVLAQQSVQEHLKQDKEYNRQFLEKEHGITEEKVLELYEFGQLQYNRGDYMMASDLLNNFRVLSTNSDLNISATWGRLASEIISLEWDTALEELVKLRELIDSRSFSDPLTQLHHRTWVIHWSLFPYFNIENGLEQLSDLFFSSTYLSTIQASCPWILRYLVAAVVSTSPKHHSSFEFQKRLRDLIRVVSQEQYEYQDPLTEFIRALYVDFDFEAAIAKLTEVEVVIKADFFLSNGAGQFLESARHLIFGVYCRVHEKMDLQQLSASLNLSKDEGEKWIANLIRDTKMDAKINESEGTVIMNHPANSVYQQVIKKTKGLSFRSNQILMAALQKESS
ncbi:unnamed protein product [Kuraishia capsulata CBS 1993]|uniref:Eukaryotic translation initiation factor 3 subunit E n=1 Tax=Kuraishia capsulata CBS 1993 TaxID=1382522 RepID=W6MIS1_9ASCO|nr:uncharacterized protein KUCA_T00000242001 [Kuraishia capsulata CBS 1993]CDK24282.1 unnamed protein product [Kuraishia capsulata CBS 1993]